MGIPAWVLALAAPYGLSKFVAEPVADGYKAYNEIRNSIETREQTEKEKEAEKYELDLKDLARKGKLADPESVPLPEDNLYARKKLNDFIAGRQTVDTLGRLVAQANSGENYNPQDLASYIAGGGNGADNTAKTIRDLARRPQTGATQIQGAPEGYLSFTDEKGSSHIIKPDIERKGFDTVDLGDKVRIVPRDGSAPYEMKKGKLPPSVVVHTGKSESEKDKDKKTERVNAQFLQSVEAQHKEFAEFGNSEQYQRLRRKTQNIINHAEKNGIRLDLESAGVDFVSNKPQQKSKQSAKTAPKAEETQTIDGKTYVKVDGQWYVK